MPSKNARFWFSAAASALSNSRAPKGIGTSTGQGRDVVYATTATSRVLPIT